jgi:hypothetical protein
MKGKREREREGEKKREGDKQSQHAISKIPEKGD